MSQNIQLNNDRPNEPKPDENVGIFWIVVAFVVNVLFWQPMKYLVKRAFKEESLVKAIAYSGCGAIFSVVLAVLAAYHVGWVHGYTLMGWLPAGIFAAFGSFVYLWCPFIIWVYRPLDRASTWLWERVHINSDYSFVPYRLRKQNDAGTDSNPEAGKSAEPKLNHLTWFSHLLVGLLYLAGIAGFSLLGWTLSHNLLNAGPEWLSWAIWALAGMIAFCITGAGSWEYSRMYSRMEGFAWMSGILAVYASVPCIARLELGCWSWALYLLELAVYVGLVFPALHTAISECFYWAYRALEKLDDSAYSDPDRDYRTFFGELVSLTISAWVGYWAFTLFALLSWPVWALALTALAAGILAYRVFGSLVSGGSFLVFLLSSVNIAGYIWCYRYDLLSASGLDIGHGIWTGISCAAIVLAVFVNYFLALPLVYVALRLLSRDLLRFAHPAGKMLHRVHSYLDARFDTVSKLARRCYNEAYLPKKDVESDRIYRKSFLHVVNLLQAVVLTAATVYCAAHGSLLGLLLAVAGGVAAFAFLYVVCGKIIVEGGVKLTGSIVSIAAGIAGGAYIHISLSSYGWLIGLAVYAISMWLVFPLAYMGLEWVMNRKGLPARIGTPLAALHERCWAKFLGGWIVAAKIVAAIMEKISRAWDRIRGKKNS